MSKLIPIFTSKQEIIKSRAFANYPNTSIVGHLCVVQVWDIQEQHCLLTVDSKESEIHGNITACSYSFAMKTLYVAADGMAVLSQKTRSPFVKAPSPVL